MTEQEAPDFTNIVEQISKRELAEKYPPRPELPSWHEDMKAEPPLKELVKFVSDRAALLEEKGLKFDSEKVRLELLSTRWLHGVGKVLTYGAKKYSPWNWAKGIEHSRLTGAALRHLLAYMGGEDNDPETGLSHLWHCSCCLMFLSHLKETHPEMDDRNK